MLTLNLLAYLALIDPAIAVAYDLMPALDARRGQFGILLQRARDAKNAYINREVAKNIEYAPSPTTATKFEYRFNERRTLSLFCAHSDVVEHPLRQIVAVRQRRFATAFDIEIEIHRDRSPLRPRGVRWKLAITN